jgi:hypothetical protein
MINLKQYELWFVTGSQHLYGPETLKQVAEDSKTVAAALSEKLPVTVVFARCYPYPVPGGQLSAQLYRINHLDAHILSGKNVDRRAYCAQETFCALAHPVQRRNSLVRH